MKRWMLGMTMVGAVAGMAGMAGAQESLPPPVIQSTLAPVKAAIAAKPTKGPSKKETYLGTTTSVASTAMREQLKLTKGVGLVVDAVEAKSPAEVAGIKQHDVLEKLNDQWLVNTEQFGALLQSMKSGDEVKLSVIRQGERKEIKAKLEEHEGKADVGDLILIAPPDAAAAANWNPAVVRTWRAAVGGAAGAAPMVLTPDRAFTVTNNVVVGEVDGKQTTEWSDDQVRIALERQGGKTTKVTMKDAKTGKVLMDGAAPAEGDALLKARPELGEKLKKAEEASTGQPMRVITVDDANGGIRQMVIRGNGAGGADMLGGGGLGGGGGVIGFGGGGGGRGKVMRWQDDNHVLVMRMMGTKPLYLLALSKKDGRTIYDGAVMTPEQRQGVPTEVAESFEMVVQHPETAKEFGLEDKK